MMMNMIMNTIPVSALNLGIGFEEYPELGRNVHHMLSISHEARISILTQADKEIPHLFHPAVKLRDDMQYDRGIHEIAGLEYHKGTQEKQVFISAVADYLLREKPHLSNQNHH